MMEIQRDESSKAVSVDLASSDIDEEHVER